MSSSKLISLYKGDLQSRSYGSDAMFGQLGRRIIPMPINYDFVPGDKEGEIFDIMTGTDDKSACWVGLDRKDMQWAAYNFCSPMAAVIDRLAEADSNGIIQFVEEETEIKVKNYRKNPKLLRIKKLLDNPNPFQTWQEYDNEQMVICKTFGYCPVFAVRPVGMDTSHTAALFNLNPFICTPEYNYTFNLIESALDKKGPIKQWRLTILGTTYTIDPQDIILVKDGLMIDPQTHLPISKVAGLDFFVSNICAAMEADNVLLKRKGPLGIFSWDPAKDMAGTPLLDPDSIDELQKMLSRYSLSLNKLQYIVSKMPVKWSSTSFNLRDLMTKETIRSGIDGICDRFGYPAELMSGKNATYENRNSAEKFLYQNNIIPFAFRRMLTYNKFFELDDVVLNLNFNHLPVLQEDILKSGEASKYESEGLDIEWKSGMITWNEWQNAKGRDSKPGMDIYYVEWAKNNNININGTEKPKPAA